MARLALALAAGLTLAGCAASGAASGLRTPGLGDVLVVRQFVNDPAFVQATLVADGFEPVFGPYAFLRLAQETRPYSGQSGAYERTSTLLADRPIRMVVTVRRGRIRSVLPWTDTYTLLVAEQEGPAGLWARIPLSRPEHADLVRGLSAIVGLDGSEVLGVTDAEGQLRRPLAVR